VILLTRLNGPVFALNPDLVERADCTPDTVITLVDGTKYVVTESLAELVALVRQYRESVIADAQTLVQRPADRPDDDRTHTGFRDDGDDAAGRRPVTDNVVPLYRRER
jgi:flagellar protein FlbD